MCFWWASSGLGAALALPPLDELPLPDELPPPVLNWPPVADPAGAWLWLNLVAPLVHAPAHRAAHPSVMTGSVQ
jgi:hypothetical protein